MGLEHPEKHCFREVSLFDLSSGSLKTSTPSLSLFDCRQKALSRQPFSWGTCQKTSGGNCLTL